MQAHFVVSLLFVAANGLLANVSLFNVSTQLTAQTTKLRVAFFDFDKTLTIAGFGDQFLGRCDPECLNYTTDAVCQCNQTVNQFGDYFTANWFDEALNGSYGFNGTDRRDRILQTLQHLDSQGVVIRVLSTAWVWINNASWAYFLEQVFVAADLQMYFNASTIMTLDDPGLNIPADKGSRAKGFMDANGWGLHEGLIIDDSKGNIDSSNGKLDWLWVLPRTGLAVDALEYIEARADQTNAPTPAPTAPTGAPTAAPTPSPSAAPTTGAPTTGAPTTGAPTTGAPTTGAPTTAAPNAGSTMPTAAPTAASPTTNSTINGAMSFVPGLCGLLPLFFQ